MEEPQFYCPLCKQTKPLSDFYKSNLSRCRDCHKKAVRDRYQKVGGRAAYERKREQLPARKKQKLEIMRRHRANNPEKYKARNAVNNAIRDGRLTRQPCKVCGTTKRVQAHHHDYSKPLEIEWLCFQHHREDEHDQTVRAPEMKLAA